MLLRFLTRFVLFVVLPVTAMVLGLPLYLAGLSGNVPPAAAGPEGPAGPGDLPIRVYINDQSELRLMPLEEYVMGVVAAEMPPTFHLEALKAQAVVARTYALRRMHIFGGPGCDQHEAADVCTDPGTGQAFATQEQLRQRWGDDFEVHWRQVERAVRATRGLILTYDGKPIDSVYHSTSGGQTASAEEVWGKPVPYLQSVPSPHESRSPRLEQTVRLSYADFAQRLGLDSQAVAALSRNGQSSLQVTRTESGRVKELRIAGKVFDGNALRQRLELNSTWLTFAEDEDSIVITARGFGHGVGMSQYGADGLARQGNSFRSILAHYYPGAELRPIFVD